MNVTFRKSFTRDLKRIKDQSILERIAEVVECVEAAKTVQEISNYKKITGTNDCYRIRVGDFRIGVVLESDSVDFIRCLHRRDIYKFFP